MTEHVPEKGYLEREFRSAAPMRDVDDAQFPVTRVVPLTQGEAALIKSIFGGEIDTDKVRKHFTDVQKPGSKAAYFIPAQTFGPDSVKFYGPVYSADDFSATANDFNYGTFVHEMTHVWQNQNPDPRKHEKDNSSYGYALSAASRFADFGEEQQAALIEDYARQFLRARRGAEAGAAYIPAHSPKGDTTPVPLALLRDVVETRFPQARRTRLALENRAASKGYDII